MEVQIQNLRLGMLGWGYWGPKLARNLASLPGVQVTMVADPDARRLQTLNIAKEIQITTRPEDIFQAQIDGVVIAAPASTHYSLAREALLCGKHVLVEKPLTTSVEEARDLVTLARQRHQVLMVGHTFEYSPAVNALKHLLERGELGKLYAITMERMSLGLFRNDIDVLWDLATHDVSILLYLLGRSPISMAVQAHTHVRPQLAEVAYLALSFADGLHAHIHSSWLHPCKIRKITLIGEQRSVIYDDTNPVEPVKIYDRGVNVYQNGHISYRIGEVYAHPVDQTEPLWLECTDFVQAIRTGQSPRSSGEVGLEVVRVLSQAQVIRSQMERPSGLAAD